MKKRSQVELPKKLNVLSSPTGVEPMTFQNISWTLKPLSNGGFMASAHAFFIYFLLSKSPFHLSLLYIYNSDHIEPCSVAGQVSHIRAKFTTLLAMSPP